MILGHFEPGGLIFAFIMLMFGRHYRKRIVMYGEMYFYLLVVSYFYFSYFHQQRFVLVVFACLALIGYQLIQQGHQQKQ